MCVCVCLLDYDANLFVDSLWSVSVFANLLPIKSRYIFSLRLVFVRREEWGGDGSVFVLGLFCFLFFPLEKWPVYVCTWFNWCCLDSRQNDCLRVVLWLIFFFATSLTSTSCRIRLCFSLLTFLMCATSVSTANALIRHNQTNEARIVAL